MSKKTEPATAGQIKMATAMERRMNVDPANWAQMTRQQATERIRVLLALSQHLRDEQRTILREYDVIDERTNKKVGTVWRWAYDSNRASLI